jgi:hypothetical protein
MTTGARWYGRGDLAASLAIIFPAWLAYDLGVLVVGRVAGADAISRALFALAGGRTAYLAIHAGIALAFLVWLHATRRTAALRVEVVAPVVLEASIYAFALHALVALAMGSGGHVVASLGAGVHEELAFRLAVLGGVVAALWRWTRIDRRAVVAIAIAASAIAFALAHHAGARGEPLVGRVVALRCAAGVAFALVAWFRSLAHAVYAHVVYDLLLAL